MFELTFLVAGPKSQTVVVALYYDAYAASIRPPQAIDAFAVVYSMKELFFLKIVPTKGRIGRKNVIHFFDGFFVFYFY